MEAGMGILERTANEGQPEIPEALAERAASAAIPEDQDLEERYSRERLM